MDKIRNAWTGLFVLLLAVAAVVFWVYGSAGHRRSVKDEKMSTLDEERAAVPFSAHSNTDDWQPSNNARSPWRQSAHVVGQDGSAAIPPRYQFGGVYRVQTGSDFEAWMSRFAASDQALLRGFDKQSFGVYRSRTPDQIAWMAANGYPMPEDVLAAQSMTVAQLRAKAVQGNIKAAYFLKSRVLDEVARRMQANSQTFGQVLSDDPQLADDLYKVRRQVMESTSPYRGFLLARQESVQDGDAAGIDVIAALYLAKMLGDDGAEARIEWYINASPSTYIRDHRQTANAALAALYVRLALLNAQGGPAGGPNVQIGIPGDPYPHQH